MKYKCIESFMVDKCDDNGFNTGKLMLIDEGTEWEREDSTAKIIGGDIHLERIFKSSKSRMSRWIEISNEILEKCFVLVTDTVLLSIKKKWWEKIKSGEKTYEIRKTKPQNASYPFRVICYVTGGVGVVGEFYCDATMKTNLYKSFMGKSCLSEKELSDYAKDKSLCGWHIKEGTVSSYGTPINLLYFGFNKAPQSWQYVR